MTEPKSKALSVKDEFKNTLNQMSPEFEKLLPPEVPVHKFMRIVQNAILDKPDLLRGDRTTLFSAILKAAQTGLAVDGKEAAIVSYGGKLAFIPMVGGFYKLFLKAGITVSSEVVYENDEFECFTDQHGPRLIHKPNWFGDRGQAIGAFALANTADGATYIEIMNAAEIEQVRKVSRASQSGPWVQWPDMMWKKSVVRRLAKRLPSSPELDRVIKHDDENYDLDKPHLEAISKSVKRKSRLEAAVGQASQKAAASDQIETINVTPDQDLGDIPEDVSQFVST